VSRRTFRGVATTAALTAAAVLAAALIAPAIEAQDKPTESIDSLAWMAGAWAGTMGRAAIEEHWIAPRGRTMLAVSRTTVGDRTVAFEFLRVEQRPNGIVYVAQPGGRPPTDFRLTASGRESATFENPQHDHPKIIRYRREGTTLVAEVEGDEKGQHVKQSFTFTRQ
jgi:hypothetical protein